MPGKVGNVRVLDGGNNRRVVLARGRLSLGNRDRLLGDLGAVRSDDLDGALCHAGQITVAVDGGNARIRGGPRHGAREPGRNIGGKLAHLKSVVTGDGAVEQSELVNSHRLIGDIGLIGVLVGFDGIDSLDITISSVVFVSDLGVLVHDVGGHDLVGGSGLGGLLGFDVEGHALGDVCGRDGVGAVGVGVKLFAIGAVDRDADLGKLVTSVGSSGELEVIGGGDRDLARGGCDYLVGVGDGRGNELEGDVGLGGLLGVGDVVSRRGRELLVGVGRGLLGLLVFNRGLGRLDRVLAIDSLIGVALDLDRLLDGLFLRGGQLFLDLGQGAGGPHGPNQQRRSCDRRDLVAQRVLTGTTPCACIVLDAHISHLLACCEHARNRPVITR